MLIIDSPASEKEIAAIVKEVWDLDPIDEEALDDICAEFARENDWPTNRSGL